jgi:hypothetical protein
MLEVSKGSNHSDLSLLNPLTFLLLLNIFKSYDPKTTSNFNRNPSLLLHFQHRSLSPNILHNPVCLTPFFKLTTHKNSPLTTSQVLQRTITLPCTIHIVKSIDHGNFSEFPILGCPLMKCKTTILTCRSTRHTHIEKDLWPLLKPLRFLSSPLSTIQTNNS